jgi:hypothetical protein
MPRLHSNFEGRKYITPCKQTHTPTGANGYLNIKEPAREEHTDQWTNDATRDDATP